MSTLVPLLQQTPYTSYTYAYPHKTAYRAFPAPIPLGELWREEKRAAAFLYIHVPFCEMRCGFCNLFTTVDPSAHFVADYLAALRREAEQVARQVGAINVARMAIGGGTPTFLAPRELEELFAVSSELFGVAPGSVPLSVESSPLTATPDRLGVLRDYGVDRISIGVQSFIEDEVRAVGRAQKTATVQQALRHIRGAGFPTLNIDLIYGLPGQTVASWLTSLRAALDYGPEELYLYPLYVRPLTGLDRIQAREKAAEEDIRLACYRAARELLLSSGYTQVSMRMFKAAHAPAETGPVYCVQDDGMLGLGCGARSYTRAYHYSNEYAVSARGVRAILADYIATPAETFASARYGFQLDQDEQRRRYLLKSLLETGGLDLAAYQQRFGHDVFTDLPDLHELVSLELVEREDDLLLLTPSGLEYSDTIGPWLYSPCVRERMGGYVLR